jgi:glycosyltransferase involved in cell wall biosynthesis
VRVSVVIPAYNEERLLPATLEALGAASDAFAGRGWTSEVIVCDNNSLDRTADLARAAGATVVFEPVNQIGRARNAGAAHASGDWLLFLDADSRPDRALFEDLCAQIESGHCLAGGSTVRLDGAGLPARILVTLWNALSRVFRWGAGSFVFCETAAYRSLGGFSEALYAGEEIELFGRLKRLARSQAKRIAILHRHPLATSARKVQLYSFGEHFIFLLNMALSRGRSLRDRKACFPWYDGRR